MSKTKKGFGGRVDLFLGKDNRYTGKECECGSKVRYKSDHRCVRCKQNDNRHETSPDSEIVARRRAIEEHQERTRCD